MKLNNKYIYIVFGPTAAGKTDFSLKFASRIKAEIINMDVGQMYVPLSIGTAKPSWQCMNIPHHLFDIISEPKNITVAQYRHMVVAKVNEIWDRGNVPVLVGGSGFYLQSLLFPPKPHQTQGEFPYEQTPDHMLWQMLNAVDPHRASMIHKNDFYRIKRALTVWHKTGQKPSEQVPIYDPICPFVLTHVTRDRSDLYARIDARVHEMMKEGWLQEASTLKDTPWESFLHTKKIIGYNDLLMYLAGPHSPEILAITIRTIAQKTRHYAKRQETFWRMLERKLHIAIHDSNAAMTAKILSFNLTLSDINLYIEQLMNEKF